MECHVFILCFGFENIVYVVNQKEFIVRKLLFARWNNGNSHNTDKEEICLHKLLT